ncbi:hypothetical protein KL930_000334 [Ogataea haglerorum]|nr:hypothetical protein KL915_000243 [Ogataea haglerorum]KAG7705881.1 hypothetical protein KL950_003457 [Ogataea haglerorum]KAG7709170.1 hypothetical protein KL914_001560 [Ogataea haglerorum]KAG7715298.1 hypothetical protein KL913_004130 [Ogataea haglerorum]KAG7715795.1 hypothetical protein KL949_004212 [Ogataea haglerorum]
MDEEAEIFDFEQANEEEILIDEKELKTQSLPPIFLGHKQYSDGADEEEYDKIVPTDPALIEQYKSGPRRISYTPPENFALVCGSIYRSSFPRIENFEFMLKLKLKSVLCLIPEEYPPENMEFLRENDIQFFQVGLSGNKEPFVKIKPGQVNEALKIIANPEHHPILVHCNRGKHRTGCIVGCIRKLQKWSLSMIFDEYRRFAYPKERPLDQQFIEMFDDSHIQEYAHHRNWLPLEW